MPKSEAERSAKSRLKKKEAGFVQVLCWAHKEDVKLIKTLELELKTKRVEESKVNISQEMRYKIANDIALLSVSKLLEQTGLSLNNEQIAEIESAAADVIQSIIDGEYESISVM